MIRLRTEGFPGGEAVDSLLAFTASMALAYCTRPEVFPAFRRIAMEACGADEALAGAMRTLTPEVLADLVGSFIEGSSG